MSSDAEHVSPDGLLRLIIVRDGDDVSLGFSGYGWHTHGGALAGAYGVAEQEALRRFVADLLGNYTVIARS